MPYFKDQLLTFPLIPVWLWLLSFGRMSQVSTRHTTFVKVAVAVGTGVVTAVVCVLVSRYCALVVWAFTLGCSAGAFFGTKSMWKIFVCGLVVAAAFEMEWGPRLRELERRGRASHRPAVDQDHTGTEEPRPFGPVRIQHHDGHTNSWAFLPSGSNHSAADSL